MRRDPVKQTALLVAVVVIGLAAGGCLGESGGAATAIRVEGSDTMVNIAQAWAEQYHLQHQEVVVQVLGGGSGVGIASLIDGNCDMANSSRLLKGDEKQKVAERRGKPAVEHVVGYDAMGIYVHPRNPIDTISIEQLAEIFGEGGKLTRWSQLGVDMPDGVSDKIIRISRQNSSGTYGYFREHVLGKKRDMGLGSLDANGSKDAVALVGRTPSAIGYTGMGYATDEVKMVRVSPRGGGPAVAPSIENARNGKYPITRPLLVYTAGEVEGTLKEYMDWIMAPGGQEIVRQLGYVPLQ